MSDYQFCPYCAETYAELGRVQTCQSCGRTVWHNSAPCAAQWSCARDDCCL